MPAPVATPPTAAPAWLAAELAAGRVLSADRANQALAEFLADRPTQKTVEGFAEFLTHAGLVTAFQAERAVAGQARTLSVGPYLIRQPVGTGSLGTVYHAVHRGDGRQLAVKVLPVRSLWHTLQAKRQVEAFAQVPPHPAVVPFVDVGTADGVHFLAWPFAEGESAERRVRRSGPLLPVDAARLVAEVADGLAVCHAHGIAHGLLNPANILIGADNRPKLLDLGVGAILAENIAEGESMLDTISTANAAINAFDYAAPETAVDPTVRTPAGDVYSLGCVLYFLLTGRPPFPDGNAVDKILAHTTQEPVPVRDHNPVVPPSFGDLVEWLMRKDPADRPADMAVVRDALRAECAHIGTRPPGETPELPNALPVPPAAGPSTLVHLGRQSDTLPARQPDSMSSVSFDLPSDEPSADGLMALPGNQRPVLPTVGPMSGRNLAKASLPVIKFTLHPDVPPAPPHPPPPEVKPPRRMRSLPDLIAFSTPTAATVPPGVGPDLLRPATPVPKPPRAGGLLGSLLGAATKIIPVALRRVADDVQVSVFGPREVGPGRKVRLQVYAHPPDAFASVCTLSRALQPDADLLSVGYLSQPVTRGAEIGLHLSVANAAVAQSLIRFAWQGRPKAKRFEMLVPWESPAGRTPAVLTVGVANVEAARVAFDLVVLARSAAGR